jgi:hypothetical protein
MLFPDERKFYAEFNGLARTLGLAATSLAEALDDPERLPRLASTVGDLERRVLDTARSIEFGVERMFVAPMDREDIHQLSTRLRRVMDMVGATAKLAWCLRATERDEHAVKLAAHLVTATAEIELAIAHIRNGQEVLTRCRAIKQAEERADAAWETAVAALFAGKPDPLEALRWMSVYGELEDSLDACEDVANELETITVKHA